MVMLATPPAAEQAAERLAQMARDILARVCFNEQQRLAFELVVQENSPLTVPAAKAAHAILSDWLCRELEFSGGERDSVRLCELVFALKEYVEAESQYQFEEGGWRLREAP